MFLNRAKRKILERREDFDNLHFRQIFDHSFGGVFEMNVLDVRIVSEKTKGTFLNRLLAESLFTEMTAMLFPPFHRFYDIFNLKLQQLFTSGIINFLSEVWVKTDSKKKYAHLFSDLNGPQVLTMKNLEAGFVVWLVSISFAINMFLLEWIAKIFEILKARFIANKTKSTRVNVSQNNKQKAIKNQKKRKEMNRTKRRG